MIKEVSMAKQELMKFISILDNIANQRIEPFTVDIRSLLDKLRAIIEKHKDTETIILDAETLYRISIVLGVQQKWIKERASSLFVDSSVIFAKVISSTSEDLVRAFLAAWRPIVRIMQVSIPLLLRGYEHFISLPTRASASELGLDRMEYPDKFPYEFEEENIMEDKLDQMRRELQSRYPEWIDYWEFIKSNDLSVKFERAYLLSFLISRGEVEVKISPIDNKIMLRSSEKKNVEDRKISLVINIGDQNE
ncbi:MAG: hypothetical protein QXI27_00690 [Nitrososphaerota archaeon]